MESELKEVLSVVPAREPANEIVNYTVIVKSKNKKYNDVYIGSCCQRRLKMFIKKDKRKRTCCVVM
jgi:hypothetical protein